MMFFKDPFHGFFLVVGFMFSPEINIFQTVTSVSS